MSVIIFYNCQIDAIKIKGIRESLKKEFPDKKMVIGQYIFFPFCSTLELEKNILGRGDFPCYFSCHLP